MIERAASLLLTFALLCALPATLDFRGVVFNTEAHPIRRTW